uniref:Isopenicillin N synthase-like Fe(2+) 2OG dioxygenase domain-containing protein n=1 Tax=Leersia perrieri TaxID=77586 RepID=A0A0D9XIJ2_9ORYZ
MAETAPATALDIAELPFSDLLLLISPDLPDDDGRRGRLLATVVTSLGRGGSGLLAITGVPRAAALRRRLLPLARRLAVMDHASRSQILKKHGLGSDVPLKKLDRRVSSFARLLRHSGEFHLLEWMSGIVSTNNEAGCPENDLGGDVIVENMGDGTDNLGELVEELGLCMMELGILVARACDIVTGGNQLEKSITDFGTAKARLIHYHSEFDIIIIKESSRQGKGSNNKIAATAYKLCPQRPGSLDGCCIRSEGGTNVMIERQKDCKDESIHGSAVSLTNLWQDWHYDYGVLTVLTAPLFLCSARGEQCSIGEECSPPDEHTYLQLLNTKKIFSVRCSPDSFIVQVGEAADILSGGKLRSTLHAVSRPYGSTNISRETFVVFLQPSWDKTLPYSGHCLAGDDDEQSDGDDLAFSDGSVISSSEHLLVQDILKRIPPLSSRLKEGMTFAEFSRQTTKQYYGGGGIQQNN